jgi:hypothetical protein
VVGFLTLAETRIKHAITLTAVLSFALGCLAQEQATNTQKPNSSSQLQRSPDNKSTLIIPVGTRLSLVLTHSVLSKTVHRGDDVYAQTTFPVALGNEVVIPPGTFVQGKVDKLERQGDRGEMHLQSMSVIFPDGYVAPIPGPLNLESDEGYAQRDPGKGYVAAAIAAPIGGAAIGALIGHAANGSPGTDINGMNFNPSKLKSTAIGSMVGLAAGGVVALVMITRGHQFFLDVGSPVAMTLQQPMLLDTDQVADAVRQAAERPTPTQPVAPRPPVSTSTPTGTCYTAGTPGTPPTIIPGMPAIGDSPGTPDTVIPGIPATPGTPYPCN